MPKYRHLLVDLDGVVWRASKRLDENIEVLNKLAEMGLDIVYFTNNSTRSRVEYYHLLKKYGVETDLEHVLNAGYLAAQYIRGRNGYKVFIIGEAGLYYECSISGLLPVTIGSDAEYVLVGLDRFLTYDKVSYATRLLRRGAGFVAANVDNVYPVEDDVAPGAGSIVSLLESSSGRKPDIVVGKPNPWVLDYIIERYGFRAEELLIVGDRVDIDILMGVKRGIDTLFVLTGVGVLEDIDKTGVKPTYVARDLSEFYNKNRELFST